MTVIQSLPLTASLDAHRVTVLDTLRRKRNIVDYTGDDMDDASVEACITEAEILRKDVLLWLKSERPDIYNAGPASGAT